jgi:hypothetical protein
MSWGVAGGPKPRSADDAPRQSASQATHYARCPLAQRRDAFSAGNDVGDFLKIRPGSGESPQTRPMDAFIRLEKPIVVPVQGMAIGGVIDAETF